MLTEELSLAPIPFTNFVGQIPNGTPNLDTRLVLEVPSRQIERTLVESWKPGLPIGVIDFSH